MARTPWWLLAAGALALIAALVIATDAGWRAIFVAVAGGVGMTVAVSAIAYAAACVLGLAIALMGLSRSRLVRELATFYVEIVRGIPVLVLLFFVAFGLGPALVAGWNAAAANLPFDASLGVRDFSLLWRAVFALVVSYSAFLAEIFRAGIEAVPHGQVEAARALGLRRTAVFRMVVLPQALRTVLPPLGNELVAIIKDSALVSALGVQDVTQLGKLYATSSFRYFETYAVVAYIYLLMTVSLSLAVRALERRLRGRGGVVESARPRPR